MILQIKDWLTSPTFPGDEEKTIRARLLHITLLSVMGFLAIAMAGGWLGGRTPATLFGIDALVVVVCLLFYYWMRQGKVRLVSIGLVTLGIITITLAVANLGTLRTPTTATYLTLVIVAGLLFDLRGIIVMTILSSLAIFGLIAAENAGLLPAPDLSVTVTQWITYTALFGASGGLTTMVLHSTRQAIQRANREIAERARVETQLRESEERFRNLYEQTPLGYQSLDAEGRLIEVNQAWLDLSGYSREEVIGRWFGDFLAPHEVDAFKQRFSRFMASGAVHVDLEMVQRAGATIIVHIDGRIGRDEQRQFKQTHCILHDVTARKRAEETLRESEEKYRGLVEQSLIGIGLSRGNRVIFANSALLRMFGYDDLEEFIKIPLLDHISPISRDQITTRLRKVDQGETQQPDFEYAILRKDGKTRTLHALSTHITLGGELYTQTIFQDITERKRAQQQLIESAAQLRALSQQLAEAQENERREMARELHDRVGQNLSALGINLNIIHSQLPETATKKLETRLDDSLQLVQETMERVRDVMGELRPAVLDDYGLLAALRWYGDRFAKRTGIAAQIQGDEPTPRLPPNVETALFRIAQEALTNIAKHARAQNATLMLEPLADGTRLTIADDGAGFDSAPFAEVGASRGWGMLTMRERAQMIGGELRVETRPGEGTRVVVEIHRGA